MKHYHQPSEQGQVIIILVLAIVGLLGFTALAVDGGMVYADRRAAQNAADAGALAAAWKIAYSLESGQPGTQITYSNWSCGNSDLSAARQQGMDTAVSQTLINQYTIDQDIGDNNGVSTTCYEVDLGTYVDRYVDITVKVTSVVPTGFAHLFYSGNLVNTVTSVSRIRPRTPLAFGYAVVALNQSACSGNSNGVVFGGSQTSSITGGGVFSNGCMRGNGSGFTVNVTDGSVGYAGSFSGDSSNINPSPGFQTERLPDSSVSIPTPDCSSLPNRTQSGSPILPGVYPSITLSSGSLTMQPGLYCLTGSPNAFRITGGTLTGSEVTIYVINGGVSVSGNADVTLVAPRSAAYAPAIQGVLFYLAEGNTNAVNLTGNSASQYEGEIYAPSGDIELSGTDDTNAFATQLIGYNVFISGNANLDITFDGPHSYQKPALLDLQQ